VPLIFERYTSRHEGSASLAQWLSERGYRTRHGKPFSAKTVLGILRNRVYVGEIFFRGVHHPAPHEPLITPERFDRAQTPTASPQTRSKTPSSPNSPHSSPSTKSASKAAPRSIRPSLCPRFDHLAV
jgi:hypothetical protein